MGIGVKLLVFNYLKAKAKSWPHNWVLKTCVYLGVVGNAAKKVLSNFPKTNYRRLRIKQ